MNVEQPVQEMLEEIPAHDEITTYLNCRYISAPEAIWRLSEYRMHEHAHTIYRLAIHLADQQRHQEMSPKQPTEHQHATHI